MSPAPSRSIASAGRRARPPVRARTESGSGAAYAGGKIGAGKIKPNAVKTSKIKDGAVTTPKLANGAVDTAQLANGAVTALNLANGAVTANELGDGSVTSAKLDPSERSQAFTASHVQVSLPPATDTVAIQTTLPTPGNYVFTVTGEFGANAATTTSIGCTLLDANNPVATGKVTTYTLATFQQTLSLTGVSDGGVVKLSCNPDSGAQVRNLALTATRVGTVTQLTSTP